MPAIPAIIAVVGTVVAAKVQANAAKKAAEQQETAGNNALGFMRDVNDQQQQNAMPYMQSGVSSLNRLNSFLTPQGQQAPPPMSIGPSQQDGEIVVIAPTGERQTRPASERAHWERLGAMIQEVAVPRVPVTNTRIPQGNASLTAMNQRLTRGGGR